MEQNRTIVVSFELYLVKITGLEEMVQLVGRLFLPILLLLMFFREDMLKIEFFAVVFLMKNSLRDEIIPDVQVYILQNVCKTPQ